MTFAGRIDPWLCAMEDAGWMCWRPRGPTADAGGASGQSRSYSCVRRNSSVRMLNLGSWSWPDRMRNSRWSLFSRELAWCNLALAFA